jgi:hypothetical protein
MSFLKQEHASGMIGLVVLGIAATLIVRVTLAGGFENYFDPTNRMDEAVQFQLKKVPGNATLLAQLEQDFPDEHDDFVDTVGAAARAEGPDNRVLVAANAWIARFFAAHARDFAAAPDAVLDKVIAAEHAYFADLQKNDEITCGAMVTGTPLDQPLPAALEEKAGALVAAKFAAIKAGRTDQQLRLALTPEDGAAMQAALRERGLVDEQLAVLAGEADPGSISKPMACEMAVALADAIRAQPQGRRSLLVGAMMGGVM